MPTNYPYFKIYVYSHGSINVVRNANLRLNNIPYHFKAKHRDINDAMMALRNRCACKYLFLKEDTQFLLVRFEGPGKSSICAVADNKNITCLDSAAKVALLSLPEIPREQHDKTI